MRERRGRAVRRQLSTVFISSFLTIGSALCALGLATPGFVQANSRLGMMAAAAGLVVAATVVWVRRGVSVRTEKILVYAITALIGLASLMIQDGSGARLITGLYAISLLFASLFFGTLDMAVLLLLAASGCVYSMRHNGDNWRLTVIHAALVLVGTISPCIMVTALRSQLAGALERSLHQANTDPLTGLANRRGLEERLPTLLHRAERHGGLVGLLMVDIDHFKAINDSYGHQIGDEVLRDVARAMRSCVRGEDLLVRIGGEEMMVLASMPAQHLVRLGERIRESVARDCAVTVSVGVAWSVPEADGNPDDFLTELAETADTYLYAAKHAGRNRVSHPELVA